MVHLRYLKTYLWLVKATHSRVNDHVKFVIPARFGAARLAYRRLPLRPGNRNDGYFTGALFLFGLVRLVGRFIGKAPTEPMPKPRSRNMLVGAPG